jgi:hypothetical protein
MAITLTDNRTIISDADATTGWTGSNTVSLFTTDPDPVEVTGCLGMVVSNTTQNAYFTLSPSVDMSGGFIIYMWIFHRAILDTRTNGGLMIQIGDGTNRRGYHVAGADIAGFRHDTGPSLWMCLLLDTGNLPTQFTTFAGSAQPNLTAINQVGIGFKTLAKAVGGATNCFWDLSRYGNPSSTNGAGMTVAGGSSGDPGTFLDLATADRSTASGDARGVVRELGAGLFGVQGQLIFGNSSGTSSSWFEDKNVAVAFESRGLTNDKYKITIVDNGVGTTTFRLGTKIGTGSDASGGDGCLIVIPTGVGGEFDAATDADVTDVFIYGSTFSGFTNGIKLRSGQEFIGCAVNASGTIDSGGATLVNSTIATSIDTSALLWNTNANTSGKLDGISFISTGTGHAIELGPNTPNEITFHGINFSGYATSDGSTGNESLYNNSGKAITINIASGGAVPTVRNGTNASTTIVASVPLNVKVIDQANNPIQNAQVAIYLTSNNTELVNDQTNVDGDVSGSFGGTTPAAIYIRVRKSSTGTKYIPVLSVGTIGGTGFNATVTLVEDLTATI